MRKFTAALVALVMSFFGVMAVGVPAVAEAPGHRAYGALYLADIDMETGTAINLPGFVSHVSGLGRVSVESFVLNLSGHDPDGDGFFNGAGSYTGSGTIRTVTGSTLQIDITEGTFELTGSYYYDEVSGKEIHGIAFGEATVTLGDGTGRLADMAGTGTVAEGFMCQFYRWGSLAFDVDLDIA